MAQMSENLPISGELILSDFRPKGKVEGSNLKIQARQLRLVQWNIERGYQLEKIIKELKNLDADIISLQEVDINCDRSGCRDVGREIAKELQLNYAFACEFEEIHSPMRSKLSQGGGVHGNAILSRFDMKARVLHHKYHPFDWENFGHQKKEPRRGRRNTIVCQIETPFGPLLCYSCHLELFCGILDRVCIVSEILADASKQKDFVPYQAILGDFNTLGHGIARLSPEHCKDSLRWWSLGRSEAEWWEDKIFSFNLEDGSKNTNLSRYNLPEQVLVDARNPGFYDPFHPNDDITLINYGGFFLGKLDWVLLRDLGVSGRRIGNHNFSASDHKWMMVDVSFNKESAIKSFQEKKDQMKRRWKRFNMTYSSVVLAWSIVSAFIVRYFGLF